MTKRSLIRFGGIFVFLLIVFASGCTPLHTPTVSPTQVSVDHVKHPLDAMADALGEIDNLMDIVNVLAVLAFGTGVVLMVYLKSSLGLSLMFGGIASLVLATLVKSMLWFVPYIGIGVFLIGGIMFCIDAKKRGFMNAVHDVQAVFKGVTVPSATL